MDPDPNGKRFGSGSEFEKTDMNTGSGVTISFGKGKHYTMLERTPKNIKNKNKVI